MDCKMYDVDRLSYKKEFVPDDETIADCGSDDNVMVWPWDPCKSPAPVDVLVITVLAGRDTDTNWGFPPVPAQLALTWKIPYSYIENK